MMNMVEWVWSQFTEKGYIWFILIILAWLVLPSLWKDWNHSRCPEFEDGAILISRKMGAGRSGKNVYEIWYGTFETDSGQIVELEISRQTYYTLQEGDHGFLRWKGNKLEEFRREKHGL